MKKIALFFVLAIVLVSCSSDDGNSSAYFMSYVDSVEMPGSYKVDSVSVIQINYKRPSDCHIYDGIYYKQDGFTRTVAVQFIRPDGQPDCQPDNTVYKMPLPFKPKVSGTYLFKFWSGRHQGHDTFLEYEIVVP